MSVLIIGRHYSVDIDFEKYVTYGFLRHIPHGNRLRFDSISEEEQSLVGGPIIVMTFLCTECGGEIKYNVNNNHIRKGDIVFHTNVNGSPGVQVSWKLVGGDVAIAHLVDYGVFVAKNQERTKIIKDPNLAYIMMKRRKGLTKEF